jgi:hypothetical protein
MESRNDTKMKHVTVWVIGLAMITVTAFAACIGILIIPLLGKTIYNRSLTFMSGIGVGSLSGSTMFIMLPQVRQQCRQYFAPSALLCYFVTTEQRAAGVNKCTNFCPTHSVDRPVTSHSYQKYFLARNLQGGVLAEKNDKCPK